MTFLQTPGPFLVLLCFRLQVSEFTVWFLNYKLVNQYDYFLKYMDIIIPLLDLLKAFVLVLSP